MADSHEPTRAAILAIYRQLCADHDMARQNIEAVQTHMRTLRAKINDCFAAARLFEFNLLAEFQGDANGDPRQPMLQAPDPIAHELSPVSVTPVSKSGPPVKVLVLDAVEQAYPRPVRAANIRQELAGRGYAIHEKTVGMTLYRWSLDGHVRRDGRDWYFVPPENRPTKANGRRFPSDSHSEPAIRLVS
jgi:hypothetical protein